MNENMDTCPLMNMRSHSHELLYAIHIIICVFLALIAFQIAGCTTISNKQGDEPAAKEESIEEKWGIHIVGFRQADAGYMLDFRYRVTYPEKAAPLFDRKTKPYLIEKTSGAKFAVPNPSKTGPLQTSGPPQADRIYFIFFGNPGKYVGTPLGRTPISIGCVG